jgi:diacylglycerol kinase family enzyme
MFYLIANPIAGNGRTLYHLPVIAEFLKKRGMPYVPHVTTGVMDAYEFVKRICGSDKPCSGIVGIGGDGTFQEIVAGMVDSYPMGTKIPVPLGVFPGGSGNDFVMTLEGSKAAAKAKFTQNINTTTENFFKAIDNQTKRTVDVITANGMAYLNIGCIGLDAQIVRNAASLKLKYGGKAYHAAVYKSILSHKNINLKIEANGKTIDKSYTLVAICNGQYYGGGFRITPPAQIDDGKITVCLCEAMSRPKTMLIFPSLMIEKHTLLKNVKFLECSELSITLPGVEDLCLDGNLYQKSGRLDFKVLPGVLDCFV